MNASSTRFVDTALLRIGYEAGGPENGFPVLLAHGWPDDVRTWGHFPQRERTTEVAPHIVDWIGAHR